MVAERRPATPEMLPVTTARWRRRFFRHGSAWVGMVLISILAAFALLAPYLATHPPGRQDLGNALAPPFQTHILGTDELGRDIFSRMLFGARISLGLSVLTVAISASIGALIGMFAGFFGGWLDEIMMRVVDILLAFPGILLAITIVAVLGASLANVLLAIGIYITPEFARLSRGVTLSAKTHDFVEAARALGAKSSRVLAKHVFPTIVSPLVVHATLRIGTVILLTSGLSFLGLGPRPPTPEWGLMLSTGKDYLRIAPHVSLIPGAAIMTAVLGFNLLGDALRDVLDPQG
jgi:peptide/nickel transport system permease protein